MRLLKRLYLSSAAVCLIAGSAHATVCDVIPMPPMVWLQDFGPINDPDNADPKFTTNNGLWGPTSALGNGFSTFAIADVPTEGWKIHISFNPKKFGTWEKPLLKVLNELQLKCRLGEPFKHKVRPLTGTYAYDQWVKAAPEQAGKLITIYTISAKDTAQLAGELAYMLKDMKGKSHVTVKGDEQMFKDLPIYYRYGILSGQSNTLHGPNNQTADDAKLRGKKPWPSWQESVGKAIKKSAPLSLKLVETRENGQ